MKQGKPQIYYYFSSWFSHLNTSFSESFSTAFCVCDLLCCIHQNLPHSQGTRYTVGYFQQNQVKTLSFRLHFNFIILLLIQLQTKWLIFGQNYPLCTSLMCFNVYEGRSISDSLERRRSEQMMKNESLLRASFFYFFSPRVSFAICQVLKGKREQEVPFSMMNEKRLRGERGTGGLS